MPDPTIPESHRDLLEAPVAALATIGPDGFPQTTALWFLAEPDDRIVLSLNTARQKTRNLRRHPECGLLIVDPANPYRTLEVRARAELVPDPDYAVADRVFAKYGNPFDPRKMDKPGESRVAVTLQPIRVNTWGEAA
jgi:PPOX class probable F420-dependent enzyme